MRSKIFVAVIFGGFFAVAAFGVPVTEIWYETIELSPGRWEYTYEVTNFSLSDLGDNPIPIEEFTIWFDYGLYDNLAVTTLDPPASNWNEIFWDPEPVLEDAGGYDALTLDTGIGIGEHVYGFAVSFDWLGVGEPGSQYYEIINPVTFETIEDGYTVPEPGTLFLLGLSGLVLLRRRCGNHHTEKSSDLSC